MEKDILFVAIALLLLMSNILITVRKETPEKHKIIRGSKTLVWGMISTALFVTLIFFMVLSIIFS